MSDKFLCMVDGMVMTLTREEALQYRALKIPIQVVKKVKE